MCAVYLWPALLTGRFSFNLMTTRKRCLAPLLSREARSSASLDPGIRVRTSARLFRARFRTPFFRTLLPRRFVFAKDFEFTMYYFDTNRAKKTKFEMTIRESLALPPWIPDNPITPITPGGPASGFNQLQS